MKKLHQRLQLRAIDNVKEDFHIAIDQQELFATLDWSMRMLDSAHVSLGVHSASTKMTNAMAAAEMLSLNFVSLKVLLGYDISQIQSI